VEDLALDRAALEHPPLGRLQLVEAGSEQRLDRGWDGHLAVGFADDRHHLRDEERVPGGGASDLLAQRGRDRVRDELVDRSLRKRLEPKHDRPARAPLG